MSKFKSIFVCQSCGAEFQKWQGQCAQCKAWNSLVEEVVERKSNKSQGTSNKRVSGKVVGLEKITGINDQRTRLQTGSAEFDRVLGGGIVPGSVVLVAGEPGIGKSTLLTQLAMNIAKGIELSAKSKSDLTNPKPLALNYSPVLYVCGEESPNQVAMRVNRLQVTSNKLHESQKIDLLPETDVDLIIETATQEKPALMIVDSVQTLSTQDLVGMAGSVGQVRECAMRLMHLAKDTGTSVMLVGHVTKEGSVVGPKVLEHMVDVVLELTGERVGRYRILRTLKNRFGATDEVGVFEMNESGLTDVINPSGAFLEESQAGKPGSGVVVIMEGTRPVLVEVQALVVKSFLPVPRRVAQGVPLAKVQLICAVLEKFCRLPLGTHDVFVSVAGGVKILEPAADLGVAMAVVSSFKNKPLPLKTACIGEVGLLGEIRRVLGLARRVKEARQLGYQSVISPEEVKSLPEAVKQWLG